MDLRHIVRAAADGIRQPGIRERDDAALQIEERVAERAVVLLELPLVQDRVRGCENAGRTEAVGRVAPAERARSYEFAGERAVERGRHTLPRNVANGDRERV